MGMEKPEVLLVHDNAADIELIKSTISALYKVVVAKSAEDVAQLPKSLTPIISICNVGFKEAGGLLVQKLIKDYPTTIHVILTDMSDTQKVVAAVQATKAFMYLNKPLNSLNIFQAIVVCTDKHKQNVTKNIHQNIIKEDLVSIERQLEEAKEKEELLQKKLEEVEVVKEDLMVKIEESKKIEYELNSQISSISTQNKGLHQTIDAISAENTNLSRKNEDYSQLVTRLQVFPHQLISTLSDILEEHEQFYFLSHITSVREIVTAMAKELGFESDDMKGLLMATMMHNIYEFNLPDVLKLAVPYYLEENLMLRYFRIFNRTINKLGNIEYLQPYVNIISQMWEHEDGSGFPKKLLGNQIDIKAQIISIANLYHNFVYRAHPAQYKLFTTKKLVTQSVVETQHRHKEALKILQRHRRWFATNVLQTFLDLEKDRTCPALMPKNHELILRLKYIDVEFVESEINHHLEEIAYIIGKPVDYKFDSSEHDIQDDIKFVPQVMPISKIKAGMMSIGPIKTLNGIEVVPARTVISKEIATKINQMAGKNIIEEEIKVEIPIMI